MANLAERNKSIARNLDQLVEEGLYFINEDGEVVQKPGVYIRSENPVLPPEFNFISGNKELVQTVHKLIHLGEEAKKTFDKPEHQTHRDAFENAVDEALDNSQLGFALTELHPTLDINLMGFIRYYIGESVGGKKEIAQRKIGRGVGDKSGKK